MTKFTLSLLTAAAISGLWCGDAYADDLTEEVIYSCSFDFLSEGSETDPAELELDDWDNIPEELIGEANYGFGGQGIMQAGGALYIPFEYNDDPDSAVPWYVEGLLWTPDFYEPMEITIELDAKIAADCSVETNDLWVYANDYVENLDYDSGAINKDWTHLTLKINAKNFEPESEDDSYYFSIFVDGGADIVIKDIVIKGKKPEVSGVSSIAAEHEVNSAIYYNLQGQKIAQPAKGSVMIKVEGEKATKIVF